MDRNEWQTAELLMLAEARALRAAFPDTTAMGRLPITGLPSALSGENATLRAALGYLRDEMLLVRAGRAGNLTVLDDEIACVEDILSHP